MQIGWDSPYYIILLLLIPLIIWLWKRLNSWQRNVRNLFADEDLQESIFDNKISKFLNYRNIILLLSVFFIILSLMGPLWGDEEQKMKREGIDMVFALDLSNSMNAEDIAPSRLLKAKSFINQYLNTLGGDRVGLVVFAGDAYAVSPLTNDYTAISNFVASLDTNLLWDQGTNLSAAINTAIQVLESKQMTSKAIVLISDGEDHEQGIDDEINNAKDKQIEIFTVGVGNESPVPIPMQSEEGFDLGYKEDNKGNTVLTSFQGDELRRIAKKSGGMYLHLEDLEGSVNQLKSAVNTLEKKQQSEVSTFNKKQQFQWFLAIALLLIFIYTLTSDNKYVNS